jgi:hypothetical protein
MGQGNASGARVKDGTKRLLWIWVFAILFTGVAINSFWRDVHSAIPVPWISWALDAFLAAIACVEWTRLLLWLRQRFSDEGSLNQSTRR